MEERPEKVEIIDTDSPVECHPNEAGAERRFTTVGGKKVSHREMLDHIGETKYAKEVHSSFFLAVALPERYFCKQCGFIGVFKSIHCARCGRAL